MTDRTAAFQTLQQGTLYAKWKADNPGSASILEEYLAGAAGLPRTDPLWGATTAGLGLFAQALDGWAVLTAPSGSAPDTLYEKWAAANPGEAATLTAFRAAPTGAPMPQVATKTGQALMLLARMLKPSHPLWQQDLVFNVKIADMDAVEKAAAKLRGFKVLAPILTHDTPATIAANRADLAASAAGYRQLGWNICGWGTYGQQTDPITDAELAATAVETNSLDGWIANGEAWAEGPDIGKTAAFLNRWLELMGAGFPLAISCLSSTTPLFARSFDFASCLAIPGVAIMPQVYGNQDPGYTIENAQAMLARAGVPRTRQSLTFGIYPVAGKQIPWAHYASYQDARGVYIGESINGPAGWSQL